MTETTPKRAFSSAIDVFTRVRILPTVAAFFAASVCAFGAEPASGTMATPQPAYATSTPQLGAPENPLSFFGGRMVLDIQERIRVEEHNNHFDFNSRVTSSTDDLWLEQRFRLGLMAKPLDWLTFYVQGQDSRELGAKRESVPFVLGAEGDDPFDLRQGYVEFGDLKRFPVALRAGRQELRYGDERLVGAFDWNNIGRTFDAVKLHYENRDARFWIDGFAGHVVTIQGRGPSENTGFNLNDANWNDTLAGLYASTTAIPIQTTDLYVIYRNKESNGPIYADDFSHTSTAYDIAQEIYTVGMRIKSLPGKLSGFDFEAEGDYQFGRSAGQQGASLPSTTMIDHRAFAGHLGGGYTWEECDLKPRVGVEYNIASGDTNPNDKTDQTFLNLFPTNHGLYGIMDLFAWKNTQNVALSVKLVPYQDPNAAWRTVTVELYGRSFWLYSNEDAWYRANGVTRVRPLNAAARGTDNHVGEEADLVVNYTPLKFLKLGAGYGHFFAAGYIEQTASGANGKNGADFAYLQATLTF